MGGPFLQRQAAWRRSRERVHSARMRSRSVSLVRDARDDGRQLVSVKAGRGFVGVGAAATPATGRSPLDLERAVRLLQPREQQRRDSHRAAGPAHGGASGSNERVRPVGLNGVVQGAPPPGRPAGKRGASAKVVLCSPIGRRWTKLLKIVRARACGYNDARAQRQPREPERRPRPRFQPPLARSYLFSTA